MHDGVDLDAVLVHAIDNATGKAIETEAAQRASERAPSVRAFDNARDPALRLIAEGITQSI